MTFPDIVGLTDFGDLAVTLPLAAGVLVWLLRVARRRAAAWWMAALGLCIFLTAVSKIFFVACPPVPNLSSPSGHAAMSTLVYGAIALVSAAELDGWRRTAAIAAGITFVAAIAGSRILLSVHSALEVGIGLAIGGTALALFAWQYLRRHPAVSSLRPLVVTSIVLVALLHGEELRAEPFLHFLGSYLQVAKVCVDGHARNDPATADG